VNDFRFDPDELGIARVLNGPEMAGFLTGAARDVAGRVDRYAPSKRRDFYDYRSNVRAVPASLTADGLEAAVEVDSPGWHLVEFGSLHYPARAPLRRAMQDAGFELDRFHLFA
jgi:hypothetical protein